MKRRTKTIDDEREIALGIDLGDKPGFVKAGSLTPSQEDKEKASDNIRLAALKGQIGNLIIDVEHQRAQMLEAVTSQFMPHSIADAMLRAGTANEEITDKKLIADWVDEMQIETRHSGLTTAVRVKGRTIAEFTAKLDVDEATKYLVESEIKRLDRENAEEMMKVSKES